jgi:hypothetical protein
VNDKRRVIVLSYHVFCCEVAYIQSGSFNHFKETVLVTLSMKLLSGRGFDQQRGGASTTHNQATYTARAGGRSTSVFK